jgi:hypothetical protein
MISSLYLIVVKFIYSFISIESYEHDEPSRAGITWLAQTNERA